MLEDARLIRTENQKARKGSQKVCYPTAEEVLVVFKSAYKAVIDSAAFKALPHRDTIAPIANLGKPLPGAVQRQFAIQDIIGEEMNAAITGQKEIDAALTDMETRINELLANL